MHGFRTLFTPNQPIKCFSHKTYNFESKVYGPESKWTFSVDNRDGPKVGKWTVMYETTERFKKVQPLPVNFWDNHRARFLEKDPESGDVTVGT